MACQDDQRPIRREQSLATRRVALRRIAVDLQTGGPVLAAHGWVIVRSSREELRQWVATNGHEGIDEVDDLIRTADESLFDELEAFIERELSGAVDYSFTRSLNTQSGILRYSTVTNHRGERPAAIELLRLVRDHGPDSYGVVYLHDDEFWGEGAIQRDRTGEDFRQVFRLWVLKDRVIREIEDDHLSPVPFDP